MKTLVLLLSLLAPRAALPPVAIHLSAHILHPGQDIRVNITTPRDERNMGMYLALDCDAIFRSSYMEMSGSSPVEVSILYPRLPSGCCTYEAKLFRRNPDETISVTTVFQVVPCADQKKRKR